MVPGGGKFLYATPYAAQIATAFDEHHYLFCLFELLDYLEDVRQEQEKIFRQLQKEPMVYALVLTSFLLRNVVRNELPSSKSTRSCLLLLQYSIQSWMLFFSNLFYSLSLMILNSDSKEDT